MTICNNFPCSVVGQALGLRRPLGPPVSQILCLDQYAQIGGGQRSLLDLLPGFSETGWNMCAAIQGGGPFAALLRETGYRTHTLPGKSDSGTKKSPLETLRYAFALPRLTQALHEIVDREKIDLLYVNGPRLLPAAAWTARKNKIPLVFHCRKRLFRESAVILAGESLRIANAWVIASCRYAAEPLRDFVWPQRLKVIYNGIQQISAAKSPRLDSLLRIGLIGRVAKEKEQMEFVRAAQLVAQKFPGCRFCMMGSPMLTDSDYRKKVFAAARNTPIEFLNWQNDLANIYSELDLIVVLSKEWESATRAIMEAFSAGIPVIALPCGGIPEIIEDERTGFLASEPTASALARRILEILRMDRSRIKSVAAQAKNAWSRRFRLETYRESVRYVLAQALHGSAC